MCTFGLLLFGCSDNTVVADATADSAQGQDSAQDSASEGGGSLQTTLTFAARVGDKPFSCQQTFAGLGTSKVTVEPRDFRFYVSDVRLIRADGVEVGFTLEDDGKWQKDGLALLDFEDGKGPCTDGNPDLNNRVIGAVPKGAYKGVRFTVGVPFAMNHQNQATAPSPLNIGQMFWSWNGGYKFLKIDGQPLADAGADGGPLKFNVHLGSTGCVGDPKDGGVVTSCAAPNRAEISLEATGGVFDPAKTTIVIDWAKLLEDNDLLVNQGGPGGCMSFPGDNDCPTVFQKLGLVFGSGLPSGKQSVFRLE